MIAVGTVPALGAGRLKEARLFTAIVEVKKRSVVII
jgi:hypothetical protein